MNTTLNNLPKKGLAGLMLGALLLVGGHALAQDGAIRLEHKAEQWEQFTDDDGVEQNRLVPAARVLPGEEVVFTVTYSNAGDDVAEDVVITNPVPEHMVYVNDSAAGDDTTITFSVDGGNTFAPPQDLTITEADGTERPATAKDYTHLRWVVARDIAAGDNGTVSFKAVVE